MKCKHLFPLYPETECDVVEELEKLENEAKLGNIPYKEAIELQKENERLKAEVAELGDKNDSHLENIEKLCGDVIDLIEDKEKLQSEVKLLKAENPQFAQFLKSNGIVQGDDGEVECAECEVWLRLKEVEGSK